MSPDSWRMSPYHWVLLLLLPCPPVAAWWLTPCMVTCWKWIQTATFWSVVMASASSKGKKSWPSLFSSRNQRLLCIELCLALQGGNPELLPQQVHPERRHRPILRPQHAFQPLWWDRTPRYTHTSQIFFFFSLHLWQIWEFSRLTAETYIYTCLVNFFTRCSRYTKWVMADLLHTQCSNMSCPDIIGPIFFCFSFKVIWYRIAIKKNLSLWMTFLNSESICWSLCPFSF